MKRALLIFAFCLGCKTHKTVEKTETVKVDSVKDSLKTENIQSITDSNVAFIKGSNIDFTKTTTVTEYQIPDNPTTEIVLNGYWSLPENTDKGKVYTDVTDTSRKAVFDSASKTVTVYKNGKVEKKVSGAVKTGLSNPIKKQTVINEHYQKQDSTKYLAAKRKEDSISRLSKSNDSTTVNIKNTANTDNKTTVSVWNWLWIAIGIAVLLLIIWIVVKKKYETIITKIKSLL